MYTSRSPCASSPILCRCRRSMFSAKSYVVLWGLPNWTNGKSHPVISCVVVSQVLCPGPNPSRSHKLGDSPCIRLLAICGMRPYHSATKGNPYAVNLSAPSRWVSGTYVFQITSGLVRMRGISLPSGTPYSCGRFVPSTPPCDCSSSVMTCTDTPQSNPLSWMTKMAEKGMVEKSTSFYTKSALRCVTRGRNELTRANAASSGVRV